MLKSSEFEALLQSAEQLGGGDAARQVGVLLRSIPTSDPAAFSDVGSALLVWASWVLLSHGHVEDAYLCASRNLEMSANHDATPDQLAEASRVMGAMCTEIGDGRQALDAFVASLKVSTEADLPLRMMQAWNSLGILFTVYGDFEEAKYCFLHAVAQAEKSHLPANERLPVWSNLMQNAFRQNKIEDGWAFAAHAEKLRIAPRTLIDRDRVSSYLLAKARLLMAADRLDEVSGILSQLTDVVSEAAPHMQARAWQVEGMLLVLQGYPTRGEPLLVKALAANQFSARLREDLLGACVWAFERVHRLDQASRFMELFLHEKRKEDCLGFALRLSTISEWRGFSNRIDQICAAILMGERRSEARLHEINQAMLEQEYLERLCITTELRDDQTGGHAYRVGRMSALLARSAGMNTEFCRVIESAARLHDIGKVGIPDAILLKPGALTESERKVMMTHSKLGADLLTSSTVPVIQMAKEIALSHHERWDGGGYPNGLSGDDIPIAAHICSIADVFDALTHERPYKRAWGVEESLREMARMSGTQFKPDLLDHFIDLIRSGEPAVLEVMALEGMDRRDMWLSHAKDKLHHLAA